MDENEGPKFPQTVPHRVIAERERLDEGELRGALAPFTLTEPLAPSHESAGGKYVSYSFSALVASREEFYELDTRLRKTPGVRMVL